MCYTFGKVRFSCRWGVWQFHIPPTLIKVTTINSHKADAFKREMCVIVSPPSPILVKTEIRNNIDGCGGWKCESSQTFIGVGMRGENGIAHGGRSAWWKCELSHFTLMNLHILSYIPMTIMKWWGVKVWNFEEKFRTFTPHPSWKWNGGGEVWNFEDSFHTFIS